MLKQEEWEETLGAADFAAKWPEHGHEALVDAVKAWWVDSPTGAELVAVAMEQWARSGVLAEGARRLYAHLKTRGWLPPR